jgi:isoleucyl-tRNA synthetase
MASKTRRSGKTSAKSARSKTSARKTRAAPKRKAAKSAAKPKAKAAKAKAKPKGAVKPKAKAKAKPKVPAKRRAKSPSAKPKAKPAPAPAIKAPAKPASLVARLEAEALKVQTGRDWSETLFLPKTDFPMKAGLPEREPELLKRWDRLGLYQRLREAGSGRAKFVLHDGPPYANGNIHIGTGLNKILKDVVVRSQQMMDKDANYVPGWDCHGLPIEWKVEGRTTAPKASPNPIYPTPRR